jgi:hypothetical protein
MAKRIIYESQIELSAAASADKEAVRLQEFTSHADNLSVHLPPGGQVGQVLVQTATGLTWKWPHINCPNGTNAVLIFEDNQVGFRSDMIQGVDTNVLREVEIL